LAVQYHLTRSTAVRAGITISGDVGDGTTLASGSSGGTTMSSQSSNSVSNDIYVQFSVQHIWYANPRDVVLFFFGVGPSVTLDHVHSTQDQLAGGGNSGSSVTTYSSNRNTWYVGAVGVAGVEWFPAAWCALHADYGESLSYKWSTSESSTTSAASPTDATSTQSTVTSTKGWTFGTGGVNFGLSIYF
jgi:hypothetical protein